MKKHVKGEEMSFRKLALESRWLWYGIAVGLSIGFLAGVVVKYVPGWF